MKRSYVAILSAALVLGACSSSTSALQTAPGAYTISTTADWLTTESAAREQAYTRGAETCAKTGKQFLLTNERITATPRGVGADKTVAVNFRCV